MRLDYNVKNLEQHMKSIDVSNVQLVTDMPVNNALEPENEIRKKVEEKFGLKVTVGPSDYLYSYHTWSVERDNGNQAGDEVCIYSQYECGGRKYHLGMIDFDTPDYFEAEKLMIELTTHSSAPWLLYRSGRSFHGYIKFALCEDNGWPKFMGRLLIANEKDQPKIVDDRWIGWCLLKGWAALRITKNNPHYLQVPELVSESDY